MLLLLFSGLYTVPAPARIVADWMGVGSIVGDAGVAPDLPPSLIGMLVVSAPNSPYASGSTPVYMGQIVDAFGDPIPGTSLASLTLTIADTLSGAIINNVSQINILNIDRGTVDAEGNLTISLLAGDTSLSETNENSIQRSLVIDFSYNGGNSVGRHQVNFQVLALAGA